MNLPGRAHSPGAGVLHHLRISSCPGFCLETRDEMTKTWAKIEPAVASGLCPGTVGR